MKILIVGADHNLAVERYYKNALITQGFSAEIFNMSELFYSKINKNIISKIWFRIHQYSFFNSLNIAFKSYIEDKKYDIIWIFKGNEISPSTLLELKNKTKSKLVNYNPDHPFIKTTHFSVNKNITESFGLYDLHFCYSKQLTKHVTEVYDIKSVWLPFGYNPEYYDKDYLKTFNAKNEINELCFIGNADKKRALWLEQMSKHNIPISIYGDGWLKYLRPSNFLKIHARVDKSSYWETLIKYRVQLNLFRKYNEGSHNMRTFEVPYAGGIMLAPNNDEHSFFFKNEDEVFLFGDINECINKTKYILELPFEKAMMIRQSAHQRSIQSGYSYTERSSIIIKAFNDLMK